MLARVSQQPARLTVYQATNAGEFGNEVVVLGTELLVRAPDGVVRVGLTRQVGEFPERRQSRVEALQGSW